MPVPSIVKWWNAGGFSDSSLSIGVTRLTNMLTVPGMTLSANAGLIVFYSLMAGSNAMVDLKPVFFQGTQLPNDSPKARLPVGFAGDSGWHSMTWATSIGTSLAAGGLLQIRWQPNRSGQAQYRDMNGCCVAIVVDPLTSYRVETSSDQFGQPPSTSFFFNLADADTNVTTGLDPIFGYMAVNATAAPIVNTSNPVVYTEMSNFTQPAFDLIQGVTVSLVNYMPDPAFPYATYPFSWSWSGSVFHAGILSDIGPGGRVVVGHRRSYAQVVG